MRRLFPLLFLPLLLYRPASQDLEVIFFSVGQGDGALVHFPTGRTALIDAGGGFGMWDVGDRVLVRELAYRGVRFLDDAILTHPDQDHGFGFLGLFPLMPPRHVWLHQKELRSDAKALASAVAASGVLQGARVHGVEEPTVLESGGAWLRLVPFDVPGRNNRFLAATLTFRGCRFLFTADAEARAERAWLAGPHRPPTVHVLKAAHHGSRTSSTPEFLRAVQARWSVLSSGLGNSYGHPHREILQRHTAAGSSVLRTDFHGAVSYRVNQKGELRCESADGPCGSVQCD